MKKSIDPEQLSITNFSISASDDPARDIGCCRCADLKVVLQQVQAYLSHLIDDADVLPGAAQGARDCLGEVNRALSL